VKNLDVNAFAERKETLEIPPPEKTQHPLLHEFLHLRYDLPLPMQPGVEMNWCTYNYDLLGEIVRRVSGRSLADFSRERIFEPLGMVDTHYIVPESARGRVVRYPADWRYAGLFTDLRLEETPWAGSGAYSTAMDMATFGQMFLNGGTYGGRRILSPASVAEMTRNQIPGISTTYGGKREFFREASWGFGWNIHGNKKDWVGGTLHSPQAFLRSSVDGVLLWADPVYDVVGSFTSVTMDDRAVCQDLFVNAVMAAVVEA
jgi:CubicO group peptidase (beta-lactamase class C family)